MFKKQVRDLRLARTDFRLARAGQMPCCVDDFSHVNAVDSRALPEKADVYQASRNPYGLLWAYGRFPAVC